MNTQDTTSLGGWITVVAAAIQLLTMIFASSIVMLAFPLYDASGVAVNVINFLLFVSPLAALTGGGLLIAHQRYAGGVITILAGIGTLIAWLGPIGFIFGPIFFVAGAVGLRLSPLTCAFAIFLPLLIYTGTAAVFAPAPIKSQIAKIEAQLSEVTGTLRWEVEAPALKAERERLRAVADSARKQFRIALIVASLLGGVGALGMTAKKKEGPNVIAKGVFYGGWLCVLLGALAFLGVL